MDFRDEIEYACGAATSGSGSSSPEPVITSGMLDADLIGHCELHCTTERALFSAAQFNRMVELAGHPEGYRMVGNDRMHLWMSMHESMEHLCRLARGRSTAATLGTDSSLEGDPDSDDEGYFSIDPTDTLVGLKWIPKTSQVQRGRPGQACDFCLNPVGKAHDMDCIRHGIVEANVCVDVTPTIDPDECDDRWIDPAILARQESVKKFREACTSRGLEATSSLFALWQDACKMTSDAHEQQVVHDTSVEELRDHLRIASVFGTPVQLSGKSADILLDHLTPCTNPTGASI